jgi:hypothetical protein
LLGSGIGKAAGNVRSRRNRGDRESLGEGEPEIEGERWSGKPGVDGRRIHSRAEGKIGDTRRAGRSVSSDGASDGGALVVAKTKGYKIIDEEESGANRSAAAGSLKSSVVGATWNMPKSSNQLSRTKEQRVLNEQVRKEIKAAGFEIGGGLNGRRRRHKQIDRIRRTTKRQGNEIIG